MPALAVLLSVACAACAPPESRRVVALPDGRSAEVVTLGASSRAVVLLPGGPSLPVGSLRSLGHQLAAAGRRVLLVDLHHRAAPSTTDPVAADVGALLAVLDSLGEREVDLVGHHYGALVASRAASRDAARVGRLVLLSPLVPDRGYLYDLAQWSPGTPGEARDSSCRGWERALSPLRLPEDAPRASATRDICARAGWTAARDRQRLAVHSALLPEWSAETMVRPTPTPALVIEGQGSAVLSHAARRWHAGLGDARLLEVAGPAGMPWLADPAAVATAIVRHLAGEGVPGSHGAQAAPDVAETTPSPAS